MSNQIMKVDPRFTREIGQIVAIVSRMDREVGKELRARMKREAVDPMADAIRRAGGPAGGQARVAAKSVRTRAGNKPKLQGGAGGGLAADLFFGAEFGGGERRSRVVGRRKDGSQYIYVRHTTRQFGEHTGTRGRWFHPTMRRNLPNVTSKIWSIVIDAVEGRLP